MSSLRVGWTVVSAVTSSVAAAAVCEAPRIRDTAPLSTAIAQDRTLGQAFRSAAQECAQAGAVCDKARDNCTALLTTTLKAQVEFDEGWWLRDIMLAYLGQVYPMSRPLVVGQALTDVSCAPDAPQLSAAAVRRLQQADRRQSILNEYPKYARWANEAFQRCKEQQAAEAQRAAQAKDEAERLATAAAAAKAAEDSRRSAEVAAKKKAEDEARRLREVEEERVRRQREAQVEAERSQREAADRAQREAKDREEAARKKAEEEAEERADAEKRAKREAQEAQEDRETQAKRERDEAAKQARRAEEERIVKEREAKKEALRAQRATLIAEAEAAADNDTAEAKARRDSLLAQISIEEEKMREAAERRVEEAKKKAADIAVPDDDERSRGALGIAGGGGYGALGGTAGNQGLFQGGFAGGQVLGHLGFWGTAPASGMADGLELRASLWFVQSISGAGAARSVEGHVSGRYFFGRLGVGATGEFRLFDSTITPGVTPERGGPRSTQLFTLGPAVGVALVDNPRVRASLNLQWLPVGSAVDLFRAAGDLELSYEYFVLDLIGGSLTDPSSPGRVGFFAMGTVGVRLRM